jgi:hypothetical protein
MTKKEKNKKSTRKPLGAKVDPDDVVSLTRVQWSQLEDRILVLEDRVTALENDGSRLLSSPPNKYILFFESALDDELKKKVEEALSDLAIEAAVVNGVAPPTLLTL